MQEEGCISCDGDCSTLRVHSSLEGVSVRVNSNGDNIQLTFRVTLAVWYTTPGQALTRRPQYTRRSGIKPPGVWRECEIGAGFHRMSRLNSFINNAGRGTYRQGHLSWSVPLSIASEAVTLTLKRATYHWNWFPYLYFLSCSSDPLKIITDNFTSISPAIVLARAYTSKIELLIKKNDCQ